MIIVSSSLHPHNAHFLKTLMLDVRLLDFVQNREIENIMGRLLFY